MKEKIKKYGKKFVKIFDPVTANRIIFMVVFAICLNMGLENRGADPYKMAILGMLSMIFLMIMTMTFKIEDYFMRKEIADEYDLPNPQPF